MLAVLTAGSVLAAPAQATFPGQNGKIAFTKCSWAFQPIPHSYDCNIWTMNPDGSGAFNVTSGTGGYEAAWSPDGTRIAFTRAAEIWTIKPNGTDATSVPLPAGVLASSPSWSPDGLQIAFLRLDGDVRDIYVANVDGTGMSALTGGPDTDLRPHWSPDGSKILFTRNGTPWIMNADGSGETVAGAPAGVRELTWSSNGSRYVYSNTDSNIFSATTGFLEMVQITEWLESDVAPNYSPDGSRVVYETSVSWSDEPSDIRNAAADASDDIVLTQGSGHEEQPDWQPIPINAYPRPKGATPFMTYLVPAYNACATPNRQHGPPLAFASCNPPTQTSNELTIGTADSNGKRTKSVSSVRFDTLVGIPSTATDEADVKITAHLIDVYTQAGLTDYAGEVTAKTTLRITDKLNTPHPGGPGAGTVSDMPYEFTIPCAATADTTIGGACLLSTSADALAPGAVTEGRRAIWGLGAVEIYDANDALFMKQGIFVP